MSTVYVVQPGDTLSTIATRFGTSVDAIARANGIGNPSFISQGQHLVIPAAAPAGPPTTGPQRVEPPPARIALRRPIGQFHSFSIGRTAMGRSIGIDCAGEGTSVVLLVGGIHSGHESNTVALVAQLEALARAGRMAVPSDVWLCFLPALNLDGLRTGLHTNARGVDLNRNWPAGNWTPKAFHPATGPVPGGNRPLSEPETRALYDFIVEAKPALVIAWHCCAFVVEANATPQARVVGRRYANAMAVDYIERWTAYHITGEFIRALEEIGIPAIDVELTSPAEPPVGAHRAAVEGALAELFGD